MFRTCFTCSGHFFLHVLTFFSHVQVILCMFRACYNLPPLFDHAGSRTERSPTPTWYRDLLPEDCAVQMQLSGKMMFLLELLKEVENIGEKILVFSQSLFVLDMIEEMVQLPECGSMIEGIHYFRLDGSTKADDRRKLMNRFNRKGLESDR